MMSARGGEGRGKGGGGAGRGAASPIVHPGCRARDAETSVEPAGKRRSGRRSVFCTGAYQAAPPSNTTMTVLRLKTMCSAIEAASRPVFA